MPPKFGDKHRIDPSKSIFETDILSTTANSLTLGPKIITPPMVDEIEINQNEFAPITPIDLPRVPRDLIAGTTNDTLEQIEIITGITLHPENNLHNLNAAKNKAQFFLQFIKQHFDIKLEKTNEEITPLLIEYFSFLPGNNNYEQRQIREKIYNVIFTCIVDQSFSNSTDILEMTLFPENEDEIKEKILARVMTLLDIIVDIPVPELKKGSEVLIPNLKALRQSIDLAENFWTDIMAMQIPPKLREEIQKLRIGIKETNAQKLTNHDEKTLKKYEKTIVNFVKKAAIFGASREGPYFCAFLKILMGYLHYLTHQDNKYWMEAQERAETFERNMFAGWYELQGDDPDITKSEMCIPQNDQHPEIDILVSGRPKTPQRTVAKMLRKPSFSMEDVADQIAIRIETDTENLKHLIDIIIAKLYQNKDPNMEIDTQNLRIVILGFDSNELGKNYEQLRSYFNKIDIGNALYFQSIYIEGKAKFGDAKKETNFEIQLSETGNHNEILLSHHNIYKGAQNIQLLCRLFSIVPMEWVNRIIEKHTNMAIQSMEKEHRVKIDDKKRFFKLAEERMLQQEQIPYWPPRIIFVDNGRRITTPATLEKLKAMGQLPPKYEKDFEKAQIATLRSQLVRKILEINNKFPLDETYVDKLLAEKVANGEHLSISFLTHEKKKVDHLEDVDF